MNELTSLLGRSGYLPHGYCFTWTPGLLWSMVIADSVIALAYFSIPLAILSYMRKRGDSPMHWVGWLFIAFIFSCGITHVMDIWTIWQPDYALQSLTKVITAVISLVTAVALWLLMPMALKMPTVAQLQAVIGSLEQEVQKRRGAEDSLAEIQQNLAATLASIGAGFIATDRAGRITRMNSVAGQVTGWSPQEAAGRPLVEVFVREDRPPELHGKNPVDVVIEQGIDVERAHDIVVIARGGAKTPLEAKAGLTYADNGAVRGMVLVFRDMSALLRAQSDSQRLAAIVASSQDAIVAKTLDGRITSWNAAARQLYGYTAEEAIGQPVQMLIPAERMDEEMQLLAAISRGVVIEPFDTLRRTKAGRLIDVSISISPIRDAKGRIIGASKIARDISRQLKAEAALRESQARLRFALEAAEIGDWDLDLTTGASKRSLRHDRCFGYSKPLADWSFDTFAAHLHPDDRDEVVRGFQLALGAGSDWRVETRVIWPDGGIHWISAQGSILREDGKAVRMLGIVTDITAQKLAIEARLTAQRLESENRQILEASRLKSQFLANMSHELRTPLNAIIGFADLLQSGVVAPESPKRKEFLGHIGNSGRHLLQLINDVLDLSKVEAGKFEFFPQPVDLPQLVDEARKILLPMAQRKHLSLTVDIAEELAEVVVDPARLKQMIYNYLSNAIKFTPAGGKVSLTARAEGADFFRIEVADTGIGIAEADLARLFIEFQQLDAGVSKQHQGTGLGLALTKRLVEAQGGTVGVRSIPGKGSVFHLILGRAPPAAVAGAPAPSVAPWATPSEAPSAAPGSRHRFLVIDSNTLGQEQIARRLGAAGFDVEVAATGAQAVQQALANKYAAFTLDLLLPDQPGLDALAAIRNEGASMAAPVLGVSMSFEAGAATAFSIADVLSKPLQRDEVIAAMTRFMAGGNIFNRVMVIDDDPMALDLMGQTLAGIGIHPLCIQDGPSALRELHDYRPDAIILDLMMPGFDGFAVLDALQGMPLARDIPVFIWTSMILNDEEYAHLARSARAIIGKGGGSLAQMLDSLSRWRPPLAAGVDEAKT